MKYMLKITCYTPKGQAEKASKSFGMKYFSGVQQPIKTTVINDHEFFYVYKYDSLKDRDKAINKKLPKAENTIRVFYHLLIHLISRAKKLKAKFNWRTEQAINWINKMLLKQNQEPKDFEEFLKDLDTSDEHDMQKFLAGVLFDTMSWEEDDEGEAA